MNGRGSHERTGQLAHPAAPTRASRRWGSPTRTTVILIGFLAMAGALLLEDHRGHVLGPLLYVLAVAAVLVCVFGHRHTGR